MKYQVDKERLIQLIYSRPSFLKAITNLTEDFCIALFKNANENTSNISDIYGAIPYRVKTLKVTQAYIHIPINRNHWRGCCFDINLIPNEHLAKLSAKDRHYIITRHDCNHIEKLPIPTKAEWVLAITNDYDNFEKVPAEVWTQDLVLSIIKKAKEDSHINLSECNFDFPRIWTSDFARLAVSHNPEALYCLPKRFITGEILAIAFASKGMDLEGADIPEEVWNQTLADQAVQNIGKNISFIPPNYLTPDNKKEAARQGYFLETLDESYPLLVAYTACNSIGLMNKRIKELICKLKDKEAFILDVVMETVESDRGFQCMDNFKEMQLPISSDLWVKILKLMPSALRKSDKSDQTDAMIDAFLSAATPEVIDYCATYINLGKIRAHHAPLLIGCKHVIIQEAIKKHLKNESNPATEDTIEINLAPSEYAKVKGLLQPEKD